MGKAMSSPAYLIEYKKPHVISRGANGFPELERCSKIQSISKLSSGFPFIGHGNPGNNSEAFCIRISRK
jgi:hypothetical protein